MRKKELSHTRQLFFGAFAEELCDERQQQKASHCKRGFFVVTNRICKELCDGIVIATRSVNHVTGDPVLRHNLHRTVPTVFNGRCHCGSVVPFPTSPVWTCRGLHLGRALPAEPSTEQSANVGSADTRSTICEKKSYRQNDSSFFGATNRI